MTQNLWPLKGIEPARLLARWPEDEPLVALISGDGAPRWGRWSILARPGATRAIHDASSALAALRDLADQAPMRPTDRSAPLGGGWIICLGYDLARAIEPTAQAESGAIDDREWPALVLWRVDDALIHDQALGSWRAIGDGGALAAALDLESGSEAGWSLDSLRINLDRSRHERIVSRTVELIEAGDIFQANIACRWSAALEGSARAFASDLLDRSQARYGAYLEVSPPDGSLARAVLSASPELFLSFDPRTRCVTTRPIKGTRPAHVRPDELTRSPKERAELHMIVDLMRNDLGRVCEYGSIRVLETGAIETHANAGGGGVHHALATIEGTLAPDQTVADLIEAAFPPGSITGAPKIRAMHVIDELERCRRGCHFGAIGYIGDDGAMQLNVAIRTAALRFEPGSTPGHARGTLDFMAGAGIVADSNPSAEWEETLAKARVLTDLCAAQRATVHAP